MLFQYKILFYLYKACVHVDLGFIHVKTICCHVANLRNMEILCWEIWRHKEKKEEATQPDPDPERDQRTVFAYQISLKADERDVYEFFSRAGKVRDVRLIMDRNSRRSKGVGYIEFYDAMSVPMAIALSGQPVLGQPVMVKPSEAEKNLVQSTTSVAGGSTGLIGPYSGGARRLYVGNLHISMSEADIRKVFEAFGQVELVQLPLDESGHCKGFGFVQFARLEDARNAQSLNGQLEIGGRTIKVSAVTDQSGMLEAGGNTGDFDDDDEGGGLSLNACSRAILMQKLDRSGTASSMVGSLGNSVVNHTGLNLPATGNILAAVPGGSPLSSIPAVSGLSGGGLQIPMATIPTIDTIGVPSECLMLKNMFDPKDETEPDFDLDIKEDVEAECSKFGTLKHIYVDKKSAGFVYLRFEDTQSAISSQRSLHGRWFAGKMITASFMVPQSYEDKFPDSR
ncbi:RNA-binding protein 39 isoform X3 [Vigna radiata var. radiata]|nr:RNA-binding protein 39 isoform X3 [Vigna radiata var. radiata]